MTMTDMPQTAALNTPASYPPGRVSDAPEKISGAARDVSRPDKRKTIKPTRDRLMTALSLVAAIGGTLVGVIGFAMSYSTLAKVALSWGFSKELAPWFPVGVDASIIAFLALDLYLIRKSTPWPLLRMAAHAMTGATIWFNASSQGQISTDPVQAASHGVMPILFVIGVEAARRLIIQKARLEAGTVTDRIPLHRWILSPVATPRFYRRMRLLNVTSYPEMIRRQQELIGYEQWLKRKYDGDLGKATEDELLPKKMAAHGYTVAQALEMPEQQERAAEARAEEAERRRLDAETRQELARKQAEADRLEAEGKLEAVRARVEGETGQARAHARAQISAAERAAELEKEALDNAVVAEARTREAKAARKEAQEREAEAEADLRAAELERQAAEKRKEAAEADRSAAAEAQAIETQAIAEARNAAAETDRDAAKTEQAAAETRRATAETDRKKAEEERRQAIALADTKRAQKDAAEAEHAAAEARLAAAEVEQRAVEIEDEAKLTSRQRAVRKVARLALAAGLVPDGLAYVDIQHELCELISIADVQREFDVSSTDTASKYRQEAVALLADGYRP
jgi:preprotein translocase subunit Sss1